MLRSTLFKLLFILVIMALQVALLFRLQLFGDEAFYWLESQNLALSYAELPGWNAWMIRLGTQLFGHNYFAVRSLGYFAFLSLFAAIYLLHKITKPKPVAFIDSAALLMSMPLVVLIVTMALADVWLLFFVVWLSYFLIRSVQSQQFWDWFFVGILVALSLNVHVRMWMWLFVAGAVFLYCFHSHKQVVKKALLIALPLGLLGLVPVLLFNDSNDYALFQFQFGRRHPWQFQMSNLGFFLSQFIVITPLVLLLWWKAVLSFRNERTNNPVLAWLLLTSLVHFLMYVLMSLFADGLRTSVHWLLISYVPVFMVLNGQLNKKLRKWSIATGLVVSLLFLIVLNLNKGENSNLQARLLDNSLGWKSLAEAVKRVKQQQNLDFIVADYFMTAAELSFELKQEVPIKVLPHVKSIKHGRQKQLEIMGMLLKAPKTFEQAALLVVEDSTLKLQDKARYYWQLCGYFEGVKYLQTVNIHASNKQFHLFAINQSQRCEIPPLFYIQHRLEGDEIVLSGWVIYHQQGIHDLSVMTGRETKVANNKIKNKGVVEQFPEITDPNAPFNGFEIRLKLSEIAQRQLTLKAVGADGKVFFSQKYYLD